MVLLPDSKGGNSSALLDDITSTLVKEGFTIEEHETANQLSLERAFLSDMLDEIYSGLIISPALSALPSV